MEQPRFELPRHRRAVGPSVPAGPLTVGSAMYRAMGWGMRFAEFELATPMDVEGHLTIDEMHRRLTDATDADLTVPMQHYDALWYASERPRRMPISEIRILATAYTEGGRRDVAAGPATDLVELVGWGDDDPTHVLFFPSLSYARTWRRRSDDLDLAFEAQRDGFGGDPERRDIVAFAKFGFYPFSNNLMDPKSGAPLEWTAFHRLDEEYPNGWVPDVPSELRWWLPKLGILDLKGVERLRPMIAQWWT